MTALLFEGLGWLGATFFIIAYARLVQGRWRPNQPIYHFFNLAGSALLVANTLYHRAWAAVCVNLIWGLIALYGWTQKT
ncbi:MAG: hypothetical protein OHK0039_44120 [Bacteroidia bacterium]